MRPTTPEAATRESNLPAGLGAGAATLPVRISIRFCAFSAAVRSGSASSSRIFRRFSAKMGSSAGPSSAIAAGTGQVGLLGSSGFERAAAGAKRRC